MQAPQVHWHLAMAALVRIDAQEPTDRRPGVPDRIENAAQALDRLHLLECDRERAQELTSSGL